MDFMQFVEVRFYSGLIQRHSRGHQKITLVVLLHNVKPSFTWSPNNYSSCFVVSASCVVFVMPGIAVVAVVIVVVVDVGVVSVMRRMR